MMNAVGRLQKVRWLSLCVMFLLPSLSLAYVQASLDRAHVYQGESFTLTISSDAPQSDMPDLSLLEKDFQVLGSGSSRQYQVINGKATAKNSWNIQLQAKGTGQFLIPSLRVGKQLTNPIQLVVSDPPEASSEESGQHIFIETEVDSADKPIYLQQQILYTVRLVFDQPIVDGSLSDPAPENALVEQLGKNKRFSSQRNGQTFTVIERRYAIFPEKSGPLLIPPLRFSGNLRDTSRSSRRQRNTDPRMQRFFAGDPFASMLDRGRPVTVQSKPTRLQVLPRPASYSAKHWLPAAGLELVDSWADQPPEFKVGEPVSRTLSINAKGLLSTLLPQLKIPDVDGVNIYPEQPETENRTDGTWVYGISKQSMSYMPTKAGALELPEQQLSWWDTEKGIERTAVLPGWTVDVLAGKGLPEQPVIEIKAMSQTDKRPETVTDLNKEPAINLLNTPWRTKLQEHWQWLVTLLLVIAIAVFWRRNKKDKLNLSGDMKLSGARESSVELQESQRKLKLRLKMACSDNDASSAAEILLQLADIAIYKGAPKTLPALATILRSGSSEVLELDRFLYSTGIEKWNSKSFYEPFKEGLLFKVADQASAEVLAPLYPETRYSQQHGKLHE